MLTERQSRVLEFVIREHVETALPVPSQILRRKYRIGVSPATIRNEMAELESLGYLRQPHTSAGRVPTGLGYRFYVESLMREEEIPREAQQTILHQFHQVESGQEAWVQLAASILAQLVENAAVVTEPHSSACLMKHMELVSLQDRTALLVLVLDQARLKQHILTLEEPCTQDELSAMATRLNRLFAGTTAEEMAAQDPSLTLVERQVADAAETMIRAVDEGTADEAHLEGLRHVLNQPEFAGGDRVMELLELLDERNLSRSIPFRTLAGAGVTVFIGADNPRLARAGEAIRECSVIISSYGAPGRASGALAVLGPMRMRYPRTISTVRYLASVMSDLLSQHYQ